MGVRCATYTMDFMPAALAGTMGAILFWQLFCLTTAYLLLMNYRAKRRCFGLLMLADSLPHRHIVE